jgi:hypothetical protein
MEKVAGAQKEIRKRQMLRSLAIRRKQYEVTGDQKEQLDVTDNQKETIRVTGDQK